MKTVLRPWHFELINATISATPKTLDFSDLIYLIVLPAHRVALLTFVLFESPVKFIRQV